MKMLYTSPGRKSAGMDWLWNVKNIQSRNTVTCITLLQEIFTKTWRGMYWELAREASPQPLHQSMMDQVLASVPTLMLPELQLTLRELKLNVMALFMSARAPKIIFTVLISLTPLVQRMDTWPGMWLAGVNKLVIEHGDIIWVVIDKI